MKNLFYSVIMLLSLFFTYSCSSESPYTGGGTEVGKKAIKFTSSASALRSSGYDPNQIARGQKVGIFINEVASSSSIAYDQNLSYTADGDGNLLGVVQYYPENGNSVRISAYHPYNEISSRRYVFAVKSMQRSVANIHESDLMFADEITQAPTDNPISLGFKHKLSRITYSLIAGTSTLDLTGAEVVAVNVYTAIEFDNQTGELGDLSEMGEVELGAENGGIIVPQTVSKGTQMLKITLPSSGKQFYYSSEGLTLESGKSYHFDLVIYSEDAIMGSTSVNNWESTEIIEGKPEESGIKRLVPLEIATSIFLDSGESERNILSFTYDKDVITSFVGTTRKYIPIGSENYATKIEVINFTYNEEGLMSGWTEHYRAYTPSGDLYKELNDVGSFIYSYSDNTFLFNYTGEFRDPDRWKMYSNDTWNLYTLSPFISYQFDGSRNLVFLEKENGNYTYEYDSKNNPFRYVQIKGSNFDFFDLGGYSNNRSIIFFGSNNRIKETGRYPNGNTSTEKYSIEYNEYNYPVVVRNKSALGTIVAIIKYKEIE
ncbi:MAG: fimbrillin family protein [Dysgonomonas sp.]|nr:fimbrillin family protein [Dysgonomonas sp.]